MPHTHGGASCYECPEGYYCDGSDLTTAVMSGAGAYCPAGSTEEEYCGAGTYSPFVGLSSVD